VCVCVCVENACETVWNALSMIVIDSMHFAYFLASFKVSWGSSILGPSGTYTHSSILGVLGYNTLLKRRWNTNMPASITQGYLSYSLRCLKATQSLSCPGILCNLICSPQTRVMLQITNTVMHTKGYLYTTAVSSALSSCSHLVQRHCPKCLAHTLYRLLWAAYMK
jgi:hypothetical protein